MHHLDVASAEFEVPVTKVDNGPRGNIGNNGDGELAEQLGHERSNGWCGVTGSIADGVAEEEAVRDLFFLRSTSRFSV
jgi:hypothetical protein